MSFLKLQAWARRKLIVVVLAPNLSEVEVHPEHHPIEVAVPDEQFEARNWTA